MRAVVLLLAASALLAGCASPGAQLDPGTVPEGPPVSLVGQMGVMHAPDAALVAVPPEATVALGGAYKHGLAAVEPTVGVDADGTLYVTALDDATGSPLLMRSDDQGQTWTQVGSPFHVVTFDPHVYVDPATGRVFQDDIQPIGCGWLSFSDDKGESWSTNPLGCGNPQVNDHQTLVAAKPRQLTTVGYPNLVYRCVNNVAYSACAVSLNGGQTFLPQVPVGSEPGVDPGYMAPLVGPVATPVCSSLTGHLKAAPDGTVYLPSSDCSIVHSPPVVSVTQDDGLTWTTHVISDRPADTHEVGIAVDEAGNVFANWVSEGRMLLASSTDAGRTWSEPIDVTAPGVTATAFNAIAAGAPGRVALAYIGTEIQGGYADRALSPDDWEGARWNAYLAVIPDALAAQPEIQSVTANDPADPVARGLCGRTRCDGMTDFIEIVIDAQGRPWASFVDVCTGGCAAAGGDANEGNEGFVATMRAGPALRGDLLPLPMLPAQGAEN